LSTYGDYQSPDISSQIWCHALGHFIPRIDDEPTVIKTAAVAGPIIFKDYSPEISYNELSRMTYDLIQDLEPCLFRPLSPIPPPAPTPAPAPIPTPRIKKIPSEQNPIASSLLSTPVDPIRFCRALEICAARKFMSVSQLCNYIFLKPNDHILKEIISESQSRISSL